MLASQLLFGRYPRQVSLRHRRIVFNGAELAHAVNAHNGYTPCFTSMYHMEKAEGDWYFTNRLDKVLCDFDGRKSVQGAVRASKFLQTQRVRHGVVRSGGGWHVYTLCDPHPLKYPNDALWNYHQWLSNESGVHFGDDGIDPVVGKSIKQCVRIPGTWNTVKQAYSGYVPWEDWLSICKDETYDYRIGKKATAEKWYSPDSTLFDLRRFDKPNRDRPVDTVKMSVPTVSGAPVVLGLNCVQAFASTKKANNPMRFVLTTYLIEEGYSLEDIYEFMKTHLDSSRWRHAMIEEGDSFKRAFERDLVTPSCDSIRAKTEFPMAKCVGCPRYKVNR